MTYLKSNLLSTVAHKAKSVIHRFNLDTGGVAAIEFAFIAPIMIAMYFGLAETASAISVDRKVSHATNVAGDLAAQVSELSAADIEEVLAATLKVLDIDDSHNVNIEIASYDLDDDDDPRLLGKVALNNGAQGFQPFNPAELDTRILNQNSGVVVARVAYRFTPLKLRYIDTDLNLRETFLLKPRRSAAVIIGEGEGSEIACTSTGRDNVSCGGASSEPST